MEIAQIIVDALSLGGLYALTALGIGLIFSVMRLANLAHAEFVTIPAYALFALSGQPVIVAVVAAVAVGVVLAVATERVAFRGLRNADSSTMLIASFAVSMLLQKLLVFSAGSRIKTLDPLPMLSRPIWIAGAQVSALKLVTIAVCALLLALLTLFLRKTPGNLNVSSPVNFECKSIKKYPAPYKSIWKKWTQLFSGLQGKPFDIAR